MTQICLAIACGLLFSAISPPVVFGSQVTPVVVQENPDVEDFILSGESIGDGWITFHSGPSQYDVDGIEKTELGIYVGPKGSRAWILAFQVKSPGTPFISAWNDVEEAWFRYFSDRIVPTPDVERATDSNGNNIPGCMESMHASGRETYDGLVMGVVQCAVTEDVIVIVSVTGTIGEIGGLSASTLLTILSLRTAGIDVRTASQQANVGAPECMPIIRFQGSSAELEAADVRTVNDASLVDRPAIQHEVLNTINAGAQVEVTGDPVRSDLVTWYPIRWPRTDEEGFILAAFLEVCE